MSVSSDNERVLQKGRALIYEGICMANSKRKKILMYPVARKAANLYIPNLVRLLSEKYDVVGADELLKTLGLDLFLSDVVHLNWIERVKGKSDFERYLSYLARLSFLRFLVLCRKPIVWTVHNRISHDKNTEVLSRKLMEHTARLCTRIHCLCRISEELPEVAPYKDKCVVIPHGDYFKNYGSDGTDLHKKYNIPPEHKILLFVGSVAPYKNIEILIDAFKEAIQTSDQRNVSLLIMGKCSSAEYIRSLEELLNAEVSEHIHFEFGYVSNEVLGGYLEQAAALVAPYDQRSSLNSGTFWMACSYAKPMIMPVIGCLQDNPEYDKAGWFYHYANEDEHRTVLCDQLKQFIKDVETPDAIEQKSRYAFEWMERNSWEANRLLWESLYEF